jgi:signal transduction histidine kinase
MSQLVLNMTLSTCYVLAGAIDAAIIKNLQEIDLRNLEAEVSSNNPAEPLLLRLVLLLLMTFGCYAVQVLLERQRRAEEEAREFGMREGQLRAAGRLAAEFAHQIKNPLAIINTAAFSLQRSLRENKPDAGEQLSMIQEEIGRADRIITEVMGYAQLSEGHVEKLNVLEELNRAIERVFPPAAHYPVEVIRSYGPNCPPLLMQRRHAAETFINVLQNAREAIGIQGGKVFVGAQCCADQSIEVSIADDGPGIPREKQTKVFEAYYTTKQKGTGLGLATVKHNVELYGGTVRLESELGKGARFILLFPAKTLLKLAKTIS